MILFYILLILWFCSSQWWRWKSAVMWSGWLHKSETRWRMRRKKEEKKNNSNQLKIVQLSYVRWLGTTACAYVVNCAIQLGHDASHLIQLFTHTHNISSILLLTCSDRRANVLFPHVFADRATVQNTYYTTWSVWPTERIRKAQHRKLEEEEKKREINCE